MFKIGVGALPPVRALPPIFAGKNLKLLKICIFQIFNYKTYMGIVLSFFCGF